MHEEGKGKSTRVRVFNGCDVLTYYFYNDKMRYCAATMMV
jgi:hypothetical protein